MNEAMYRLQIQSGPESGRQYVLESGSITIGRYPLADIVVNEPDIAYRHALLTRSGDTYRIADLGSDAGTYVNGRRIGAEAVALNHGDVVLLGARTSVAYLSLPETPLVPDTGDVLDNDPGANDPRTDDAGLPVDIYETETAGNEYDPIFSGETDGLGTTPIDRLDISDAAAQSGPQTTDMHYPGPLPAMPPTQKNRNGRIILIAAGCLLAFLACCCSTTLFMYYIGGDWLLNQLGYLP